MGFTIVWPEGVIFGSIMTYHVQILLLVRQPLFDRAALLLTQTSWVLPPLSVGKMTLRLYGALNYSHGLSKGPSFGTGREGRSAGRLRPTNYPVERLERFAMTSAEQVGDIEIDPTPAEIDAAAHRIAARADMKGPSRAARGSKALWRKGIGFSDEGARLP